MTSKPMSVLITGANRGLGLEMVKQMLETQRPLSLLFACCRDPDGPKAEGLRALAKKHPDIIKVICMDTADRSSIKRSAQQVGSLLGEKGLNLIINNAAILTHSTVANSTPEDMASTFNTNVIGPMSVIQEFLPLLRAAAKDSGMPGMSCRKAAVVSISSTLGSIEHIKHLYAQLKTLPYCVSKAALNMLSACAAAELQKEEILCTLLHPGWVRTDMGGANASIDAQESVQGMLQVINSMTEKHSGALLDYKGQSIPW
ncbi:C-signal-like isoform X3 [Eucyclogobius newberryi]|uniref:C-signal-like isoform X3 n=1 Tax=Eucyclogobius newberryi TaxID=166745 RepID=UPI003B5C2612